MPRRRRHPLHALRLLALVFALFGASASWAQLQSGSLFGTVTDDAGQPLPGVTVTLTGAGAPQVQVTDAQGQFRFPALSPGSYTAERRARGLLDRRLSEQSRSTSAATPELEVTLNAAVEDVITVTAEAPLLDERRISTGATVSQDRAREDPDRPRPVGDPAVHPRRAHRPHQRRRQRERPAVAVRRPRLGRRPGGLVGRRRGDHRHGGPRLLAGATTTSTRSRRCRSRPAARDASIATGGVVLNMVTKRGTNEWRGSARYLLADDALAVGHRLRRRPSSADQTALEQRPRAAAVQAGQPDRRRRGLRRSSSAARSSRIALWVWGSYGQASRSTC